MAIKQAKGPNWQWHYQRDLDSACERDAAYCK